MRATSSRRTIVGVLGSGSEEHRERAEPLGRLLAALGVHLLTGGGAGVMSAVSRAFWAEPDRRGLVLGILPADPDEAIPRPRSGYPNPWVEIAVQTHLPLSGERGIEPLSRNHINVLTSDALVVLPGGAGTVSEAHLARRYRRPVCAWIDAESELPGAPADLPRVTSLREVEAFLRAALGLPPRSHEEHEGGHEEDSE